METHINTCKFKSRRIFISIIVSYYNIYNFREWYKILCKSDQHSEWL